jgi:hypothetical protein
MICPIIKRIKKIMADFTSRVKRLFELLTVGREELLAENADLKGRLAVALANDAADLETIAAAESAAAEAVATATAAVAETERLVALVEADTAEDAALEELLSTLEASVAPAVEAPEAPVEVAPEAPVEVPVEVAEEPAAE